MNSTTPHAAVHTPRSTRVDFTSALNGRTYRLMISQPFAEAPPDGYPVLWVLDAQGYHGFVTDMTRNRALGQQISPVLVVAVGYPDEEPAVWFKRRILDLTPTSPSGDATLSAQLAARGGAGGLEGFLDVLQHEALAKVGATFTIDRQRMALWGHSLGGLAVLHTLFTRPTLFESYLAISPSIWWDDAAVLQHEARFAEQVRSGVIAPRVLIAAGGLEDEPPTGLPPGYPGTLQDLTGQLAGTQMAPNARALSGRLANLPTTAGFALRFECPPDEDHLTNPYATLRAALNLAFPPAPASL